MNCLNCRKKLQYIPEFQTEKKTTWLCLKCAIVIQVKKEAPSKALQKFFKGVWRVSLYKGER
jgi:hypothetical protein